MFLSDHDRRALYRNANKILHNLYEYCLANRLVINYEKCCFIEFNKGEEDDPLILGIMNNVFLPVEQCKFLGVKINSKLDWKNQIENVINQVSKACGTIYSVRRHVPQKILRTIYMAIVQPYLIYCIPLWGSSLTSEMINKLFILQKKCVRLVSNKTERINYALPHTKPLFSKLQIMTVFNLYTYMTACESMKIYKFEIPKTLFEFYEFSKISDRFIPPSFNLTTIKTKSFIFNSTKILNLLLKHDIKYSELSVANFKLRLKKHLLHIQSKSVHGDESWLPCNHNLFSEVTV